jgi:Ca2+-binding RTX toxin-like protein
MIWGVAATAVLAAAPAHASTFGREGLTVTLRVGTGEPIPTVRYANHGPAFAQPPEYTAGLQPPQPVTAAAGCRQHNPSLVVCDDTGGITAFAAHFGDGSDRFELGAMVLGQIAPFPLPTTMYGNGGPDSLVGSPVAANRLEGGAGSDTLKGGSAQDQLYLGPDGGVAEGHGGDDLLYGGDNGDANALVGGAGNDQLFGGAAPTSLLGEIGDDAVTGGPAADILEGGDGTDVLEGADGDDRLNGGPGRDRIAGGPGKDVIEARDGQADDISCGPGVDIVIRDRDDRLPADCEVAPRLGWSGFFVDGYTVGFTLRRFSERVTGRVTAHRCLESPHGHQLSCRKGERSGNFGSRRFSGKPGDRVRIRIKLDAADVRNKLRRPGRNPNHRDVWLLVRFRDRDGQEGTRGTRLLIRLR